MNIKKEKPIFAVIYRSYVKSDKEKEYLAHWKSIAAYFVAEKGALGSTLHKTKEGVFVAYSRWPDKTTRDACWPKKGEKPNFQLPNHIREAIEGLIQCLDTDKEFPEISMEVIEEIS